MTIPLRCRCGKLQGHVATTGVKARAVCYCKDCQAFGQFLGTGSLDAAGGTEVAATLPAAIHFETGLEHLACMSLSPKGLYRWYASCCRTPIGATPRDPHSSYIGLVRACLALSDEALDRELGSRKAKVQTDTATAPVESSAIETARVVFKVGTMLVKARLGGGYKDNPFFQPRSGTPVKPVLVLSLEERKALTP